MRWFNIMRVRRVLKSGGATYESARRIEAAKGLNFVQYLRARRVAVRTTRSIFIDYSQENKAWLRSRHIRRKRLGLRPVKIVW